MAKEITISMADSQFESLQEAYAKDDGNVEKADVDVAYVKGRLMNILKADGAGADSKAELVEKIEAYLASLE